MPTTRKDTGSLNYNELIFAYEYVLCRFNATEAYARTYDVSNRKVAAIEGHKLANTAKVRRFIDQVIMKPVYDKYRVTSKRIIEELASVAFSNIADVAEIEDGQLRINDTIDNDDRANSAISEISVVGGKTNLKMHDKTKALQLLGKYHGMEMEFNQIVMGLQQYGYQMIQDAETGELQLKSIRKRQIPFDIGDHVIRDVIDTPSNSIEASTNELPATTVDKLEIEVPLSVDEYDDLGRLPDDALVEEDEALGALPLEYNTPPEKQERIEELEQEIEITQGDTVKRIVRSNPFK